MLVLVGEFTLSSADSIKKKLLIAALKIKNNGIYKITSNKNLIIV